MGLVAGVCEAGFSTSDAMGAGVSDLKLLPFSEKAPYALSIYLPL
jgi:hypothetical protein